MANEQQQLYIMNNTLECILKNLKTIASSAGQNYTALLTEIKDKVTESTTKSSESATSLEDLKHKLDTVNTNLTTLGNGLNELKQVMKDNKDEIITKVNALIAKFP